MKKIFFAAALLATLVACNNSSKDSKVENVASQSDIKTAYIDTTILMEECLEAKDISAKYDALIEEKSKSIEADIKQFQNEVANFQQNAEKNGPQWAQTKGAQLQQREQQIAQKRNTVLGELQEKGAKEMQDLVKRIKDYIKVYGQEQGYQYIYGTGDVATVLYAAEGLDLTQVVLDKINEEYKNPKTDKVLKDSTVTK